MSNPDPYQKVQEAAEAIQKKFSTRPQIGVILGSGLSSIADEVSHPTSISYSELPHFHGTSVEGHPGKMVLGYLKEIPIVFLLGRFHYYEGYSMQDVAFPTRTIAALGVKTLILTNAAGAINTRFRPADIMLIEDHINLMGDHPLRGPNPSHWGPRFPDMSEAYKKPLLTLFQQVAATLDIPVHTGVYAGLSGPSYETPAEVRMLRALGADAVGMSTVPETIAANHLGIHVTGLSCITNLAAGLSRHHLSHHEVVEMSQLGAKKMKQLVIAAMPKIIDARKAVP